ncbi:hypothetical protein [Campylobacter sp. US33a]|uniref:hypothetical protein n=1 Tax=Campylobacter sp. US33a TaxID=2498120 RepID=UPI0010680A7C|nr:hypothetical protein [Campylobacter sp. US33a]TEY04047.1 hypothetical protein ELQ16_02065 [Campylobacter sp. US33a]
MLSVLSVLLLVGCSIGGMGTARHNGKMYYFPSDCPRYNYSYSNPDELRCTDENGVETGRILYPASEQEIENYRYQQEQVKEEWRQLNESLHDIGDRIHEKNKELQRSNEQLMQMMPRRHDVYIHYY